MAPTCRTVVLPSQVARLKGRKILVFGNYDRCWAGHSGHITKRVHYYQIGVGVDAWHTSPPFPSKSSPAITDCWGASRVPAQL